MGDILAPAWPSNLPLLVIVLVEKQGSQEKAACCSPISQGQGSPSSSCLVLLGSQLHWLCVETRGVRVEEELPFCTLLLEMLSEIYSESLMLLRKAVLK